MRIVGGTLGGRRFPAPPGAGTRPTAERVREALASRLEARGAIADAEVLDLFAGTGALAFEALSRGARRAVLVDRDRRVVSAARRSAAELGLADRVEVVSGDLLRRPDQVAERLTGRFQLVFADPPYAEVHRLGAVFAALDAAERIADGAWVVVEHARRDEVAGLPQNLAQESSARYGDSAVTLFRRLAPETVTP